MKVPLNEIQQYMYFKPQQYLQPKIWALNFNDSILILKVLYGFETVTLKLIIMTEAEHNINNLVIFCSFLQTELCQTSNKPNEDPQCGFNYRYLHRLNICNSTQKRHGLQVIGL